MRSQRFLLLLSLIILCSFVSLPVLAQDEYDLELNLTAGQNYNLKIKAVQQFKQDFFGNQMTIKQKFITKNSYHVQEIDSNNNYILDVKYDDLQVELQELGGDFGGVDEGEYKTKFNNSMQQAARSIEGQEFRMKVSPEGQLLSLEGYEDLLERWQKAVQKYQNENDMTTGVGIENFFDEKFMEQLWKNVFAYIPQEPVELEESWQSKFRLTAPLTTAISNNYTLKEVKTDAKTILTKAPLEIKDLTLPQQKEENISYNLNGQQKGKLILDSQSNWIQRGELDFNAQGNMEVESSMVDQKLLMPISSTIQINLSSY
ncbi:MAG: DUF6263 family protein [Halanaerobacter sp.]